MSQDQYQKLMGYCRQCDETGCLEWVGGMGGIHKTTPVFHLPGSRGNKRTMPAYKAHWLLAGKQLRKGECVFRKCGNLKCIAIDHLAAATRKLMYSILKKDGRFRGVPARRLANASNRMGQIVPVEKIRKIEELLGAGWLQKHVATEVGVSKDIVLKAKRQQHFHSSARQRVLPGASVFSLGAAA